jgi:hypothetical protein
MAAIRVQTKLATFRKGTQESVAAKVRDGSGRQIPTSLEKAIIPIPTYQTTSKLLIISDEATRNLDHCQTNGSVQVIDERKATNPRRWNMKASRGILKTHFHVGSFYRNIGNYKHDS